MYITCRETHVFLAGKKLSGDFFFQVVEAHLNVSLPSGPANSGIDRFGSSPQRRTNRSFEWWVISQSNLYKLQTKPEVALKCIAAPLPSLNNLELKVFCALLLCWSYERAKNTTTQQAPESELLLISFQMSYRVREGIVSGGSSTTRLDAARGQHARLNNCKPFFIFMLLMLPLKPPEERFQLTRQPITSSAATSHYAFMLLCDVMTSSSTTGRRST